MILLAPACCSLQPMVLVFQELSLTAAELQSPAMRRMNQFLERGLRNVTVQQVSGNLSPFHVPNVESSSVTPLPLVASALPTQGAPISPSPSQSSAEATGHWRGLSQDAPCAAPTEGIAPIYLIRCFSGNFGGTLAVAA